MNEEKNIKMKNAILQEIDTNLEELNSKFSEFRESYITVQKQFSNLYTSFQKIQFFEDFILEDKRSNHEQQ